MIRAGVTGHRLDLIGSENTGCLRERVGDVLGLVARTGREILAAEQSCFASTVPRLCLVSPLADGADQLAAEVALELGWELEAILPFERGQYRQRLAKGTVARFDQLLARATCILELPGNTANDLDAYVMTGRAIVAHSDLLIALWDGEAPRGRGGTGEVVQLAIVNGTPVIHVPTNVTGPARLMWSAFDPSVVTHGVGETTARPLERKYLDQVLTACLSPPADPNERRFLALFQDERFRRLRARIEYPLLLAAAGVKTVRARDIRDDQSVAEVREEWAIYRERCATHHDIELSLQLVEDAFCSSDRLATYFAQTYRSGHVLNFVIGGVAVCVGLIANIFNRALLDFALIEGFLTACILINTRLGVKQEWHRRWLDYRQLAERLRPMRSLKLLGIATPDPPGTVANPVPRRWVDWYAASVWRAMGCPSGTIDSARIDSLADAIASYEVAPQVSYHQRHAHQIDLLDERLERIAAGLFWATLVVSAIVVIGLAIAPATINRYDSWFTLVEAGFPALGTAVFGIRFQGDFGGSAVRSLATAASLKRIETELIATTDLQRAADLTEQAARTMLADLEEWRLVNQQQELDLL